MKFFRIILLLTSYFLLLTSAYSQYYIVGQDPASIRWRYIKTEHFKIIYPDDFEKKGQEVANNMEHVWNYDRRTIGFKPTLCPVILHDKTIEPNGFTMWAPRRIEFYTCPDQQTYTEDWLKQLCVHEYRHYVQMSKLNQGFTRWLSYILGEQGTGLVLGLYEPDWFMEGDAVATETAYSNSGRGRLPSFELEIRAQVLDKGIYSFDKGTYGSYRDFVPNWYEVGYPLVAYARKIYGAKIWDSTLNMVAKRPYILTPFNKGIKNVTGLSKVGLYKKTFSDLHDLWTIQEKATTLTPFIKITNNTDKQYWKYKFPAYINDSTIFAERSGLDDIPRFVIINKRTRNEKVIYTPGLYFADDLIYVSQFTHTFNTIISNQPGSLTADNITMGNGKIVWAEKVFNKRWDNCSYSVIKILDLKTHKTRQLTRKSRYFAPAISPDGKRLVASKVTEDNHYSLVLLDINTGKALKEILLSYSNFYITPSWTADSKKIVVIVLNNSGKRIDIVNPDYVQSDKSDKSDKILLPPSFYDIYKPKLIGKYVFYNSYYSGIDNIYALDTATSKVYQVTSSKYGAYNMDYSEKLNRIVYSDYSANGFDIVEADYKPSEWIPKESLNDNSVKLYESLLKQESGNLDTDTANQVTFNSKKYSKLGNLFTFHSWTPAYLDVNNINIKPGVSLISQNLLSTAVTGVGWYYNTNEKHGREFADFTYYGLYPVIDFHYDYGVRDYYPSNATETGVKYYETNLNSDVYIPFNFSTGKYFKFIQPEIGFNYEILNSSITKPDTLSFSSYENKTLKIPYQLHSAPSLFYELFAYNMLKTGTRDIASKWGQVIDVLYSHDPFNSNDKSVVFSSAATLYFPGLFNHHSFSIYGAYQDKTIGYNDYSDQIRLPYGFSGIDDNNMKMLSLAYHLPLIYPDISLGPLVYIMRVTGGVFFDYSTFSPNFTYNYDNIISTPNNNYYYRSTGVELYFDTHLLRFIAPIDFGVRAIYSPDYNRIGISKFSFQFLYAINLRNL